MNNEKARVCPVELAGSLDSKIRRWLQNPAKILAPFIKEGMKVLVLEKSSRVGGRDISFNLKNESPDEYQRLLRDSAYTWYVKSEPDLPELFSQAYLDGYTVEAGIHTLMVTEKGRTCMCLTYLGKPLTLYPAVSAGW